MSKKIQKIISISTTIATIAWISGVSMLAPLGAFATTIADGAMIRTTANPDVYIVKLLNGKMFKRLILSPSVFNSYQHLHWYNVITVDQATMDSYTTSGLVRALGDTKVYLLTPTPNSDIGAKQWVNMTADSFTACKTSNATFDWDSVYTINNVDRDSYTDSTDITTCSGASIPPPVSNGALTVSLASDTPPAGLAVGAAARVPFTKVNFTTGSAAATITGLTVQRAGLADDGAFVSLVLIDPDTNLQVGLSQTLNALHQVTFTTSITIPANTTKSYILAGNMTTQALMGALYAGDVAILTLVSVTAGGTVSGLPISGNYQTMNGALTIGSALVSTGAYDPNASTTNQAVGTTGFKFSGIKITAGATEDVTVYSISWNQSGSAASSDLANVVTTANGTDYATTVSSDGKYYTSSFGSAGIVIAKGLSLDFTIKGNIVGGSARTVKFDIYRATDIAVKGNTFGYYLTPTSGSARFSTTTNPFYYAYTLTIGTGTLRIDKDSTLAPSGNVTLGAQGVTLGAFDFVVLGEPVNVTSIIVDFTQTGTGSTTNITSITLNTAAGAVLAGPVNGLTVANGRGTATFSGTVTFPVGTTQVIVKGNLSTAFAANDTIVVGFGSAAAGTTAASRVTGITGGTTGVNLTATPAQVISSNTMTVKAGALTITVLGTPVIQTVIKGVTGYTFANYLLDASASGEDIRVTTIQLQDTLGATASLLDISNLVLYDTSTNLPANTGSNVVSPSSAGTVPGTNQVTFTLDNGFIVPKGTTKTLALKANITGAAAADATDTHSWGVQAAATVSAIGASTTQTITITTTVQPGQAQTISTAGQYSVALDASTPIGKLIAGNSTGNTMTVFKFYATSEPVLITKVLLGLTNASSSGKDLSNVYLYDGSNLLTTGIFNGTGASSNASTTFSLCADATGASCPTIGGVKTTPLIVPQNDMKIVTVKADIAPITTTATVATSGHQISINYINTYSATYNLGTGQSSGQQVLGFAAVNAATTAQTAAYINRSVPTVAAVALPTYVLTNGVMTLAKFSVSADSHGSIDLAKVKFKITTSTPSTAVNLAIANLTLVDVTSGIETTYYASTTNYYSDVWGTGGLLANEASSTIFIGLLAPPGTIGNAATADTIAAGTAKTFELRATISGAAVGSSISTALQGDALAPTAMNGTLLSYANVQLDANNDFIWSDFSDATHNSSGLAGSDYMNGYLAAGLPSSQLAAQTISK